MYVTQDRIRVTVDSMPGVVFSKLAGGGGERTIAAMHPGAGDDPEMIAGRLTYGDVTLTKPWNPDTDMPLWRRMSANDKFRGSTVTAVDLDEDDNAIPEATRRYTGGILKSFQDPPADSDGADPAEWSIVFAVRRAV